MVKFIYLGVRCHSRAIAYNYKIKRMRTFLQKDAIDGKLLKIEPEVFEKDWLLEIKPGAHLKVQRKQFWR